MEHLFDLNVAKNRLSATIMLKNDQVNEEITVEMLNEWLQKRKIVFGIDQDILKAIANNPMICRNPVQVAKGIESKHGSDAYLINEVVKKDESSDENEEARAFNFRNILKIPSVKSGQLLATIVPPTQGSAGKDIYGNILQPRPGRQLRLKPGKNIIYHMDKIFATTDGQISITSNSVNVFPVFEVKGDIDLNTGNIDFIGNVIIRGNVPSGYEIKAGGDVKIHGLVEGATITAGGSIHISGGIAGQKKANIKAAVDVQTLYINQAVVSAGNDVLVENFIMHSEVSAANRIVGKKSQIIGGKISASRSIEVREIGNQHFARTDVYIGSASELIQNERNVLAEMNKMKDGLGKLAQLKERLMTKRNVSGKLTVPEEQMLKKQHETEIALKQKLVQLEDELAIIRQNMTHNENGLLIVHGKIHPNNQVYFVKYAKVIQQPLTSVKLFLEQGEVTSVPL